MISTYVFYENKAYEIQSCDIFVDLLKNNNQ